MVDEIRLWPGVAPGSEGWTHEELFVVAPGTVRVRNVVVPTLTPFVPAAPNGTAVIVAPGGGFHELGLDYEGTEVAEWLCERGVSAFLLRYRLRFTGTTEESFGAAMAKFFEPMFRDMRLDLSSVADIRALAAADGAAAMRIVRARAAEWGIDPGHVGFLGFSAGAFVATDVVFSGDTAVRPDFVAPIYGGEVTGSLDDAPPLFCAVAADDWLTFEGCQAMVDAWRAADRPAELHVYESGGHGFGMRAAPPAAEWIDRLGEWIATECGRSTSR